MSDNENTVLLEVYRSVGQLESKLESVSKALGEGFTAVNKRVDAIEQKMDEKKNKFWYPVSVTLAASALIGLVTLIIRVITYMDTIAKGVRP